jgi:hypothetical protein
VIDEIVATMQAHPKADTARLERKTDQELSTLNGLPRKEIKIVEGQAL